jgi:mRNA interferase MazF
MGVVAHRFDIYLVNLDPTVGYEIRKTRPCLIVSPDEMNRNVQTVIVAPMSTKGQPYVSRVACTFQGKHGHIVLDQIRATDRVRLVKRLGKLSGASTAAVLAVLGAMFAE